jgi:hypothetical protein
VWIYATMNAYEPLPGESPDTASQRMRECIHRAADKGSIVEFVQHRDWTARQSEVPLEVVRERLRHYRDTGRLLDSEGPLTGPAAVRIGQPGVDPASDVKRAVAGRVGTDEIARGADGREAKAELNRRRYDWMPSPPAPPETDVERRLRLWREAQGALDRGREREVPSPAQSSQTVNPAARLPADPKLSPALSPDRGHRPPEKSELNRRRYDWTPAPDVLGAIARPPRGRGPERGR